MKIVIPTFKRELILKNKTLKLLENHHISPFFVDIIVESKTAKEDYQKVIGFDYNIIVSNTNGICEKRNFIRWYYRYETEIEEILCIDDDIDSVNAVFNGADIKNLFIRGFDLARQAGATLWGINHIHNHLFMKNQKPVITRPCYIQGGFAGIIIDRNKDPIYADVDHYEDFQFSLEHYLRDGAILKLNHYYIKTDYKNTKGGIVASLGSVEARKQNAKENMVYMLNRYGNMLKKKESKYGEDLLVNPYYRIPITV